MNEMKMSDRLNGLGSQCVQETEPMQDLLSVGLNGLDPGETGKSPLPLDNADANALPRKDQSQNRAAASGANDDDVMSHRQSSKRL